MTAGFINPYALRTAFFSLLVQLVETVKFAAFLFQFNTIYRVLFLQLKKLKLLDLVRL